MPPKTVRQQATNGPQEASEQNDQGGEVSRSNFTEPPESSPFRIPDPNQMPGQAVPRTKSLAEFRSCPRPRCPWRGLDARADTIRRQAGEPRRNSHRHAKQEPESYEG